MRRRVTLRMLLLVPLVLQLAVTAGLITLVGYQGRQRSADALAAKAQLRVSRQVADYLRNYLSTPQQMIRLMADAVESGRLDPADRPALVHFLWSLHGLFPNAPYLNFGWANGDFIGVGQVDNTNPQAFLEVADAGSISHLEQIRLDQRGRPVGTTRLKSFADFRGDGWYSEPIRAGRPVWTPIYNWVDAPDVVVIGAGTPVRRSGRVVGVAGVDLFLANISGYLRSLPVSQAGEIYIIDQNGQLVADASERLPFAVVNGRGVRRRAQDSPDRMIRETARALLRQGAQIGSLNAPLHQRLPIGHEDALVRVDPFRDAQGLNWRIVVVIPESEVYGNLRREALNHLVISLVAIAISGGIALMVIDFVTHRLDRLVLGTDAMAEGDLSQSVELGSIQEMSRLAESFNTMATRLRRSFSTLRLRNREIQRLVNERTESLARLELQLREERRERRRLEQTLSGVFQPAAALADPGTGLFNRPGLERRLLNGARPSAGEAAGPVLLIVLMLGQDGEPGELEANHRQTIAERLEPLVADHQGLAAFLGGGRFAVMLPGLDASAAQALIGSLAEAMQPLRLWAGVAAAAPGADNQVWQALLQRAEAALEAVIMESGPGAGPRWRLAG